MSGEHTDRRGLPVILAVAVAGGVALGAVDLVAQRALPYPWANLANSSAVWAVGAFAIGAWVRTGRWRPALAGVVLLVVAVESYYLAATLIQNDDLANLWAPTSLVWMAFGVLAGVVFGTFGAWSRSAVRWRAVAGPAALGAVFLAEAALLLGRRSSMEAQYRTDGLATALITAVIGLALPLLLARGRRARLYALAAAVPLAAVGYLGFRAAGFGA
ncbi:DUF6518 family protein [Glycomyces sp. A-F 0318]|uniref:DUF6518 family protein n=1 Tax=Glycomyces amatae TaxID=2881355 RepID=UPI001E316EDF|nr:DUF6518 family protein [Glycomyces amatae]MCD0444737.1 DUF6518 family protein [Glycomyces amatae]